MNLAYEIQDAADELAAVEAEIARRERALLIKQHLVPKFRRYLKPARNKGAHGGRGSAKSWSFAKLIIIWCIDNPGTRVVCIREVQKTLGQSVKRLLEDEIQREAVGDLFKVGAHTIGTPGGGIIIFQGMQDHTAESIKSLEGFDIAWVEEAQTMSARSLMMLRPTLRKPKSELWFTWNPRHKTDPVDDFLRNEKNPPPDSIIQQVNWQDNPHFPDVLRLEMEWDRRRDPDKYAHVWAGAYERNSEARVFKNWTIAAFDIPDRVEWLLGGDFGFANDPTTAIAGWVDEAAKKLFLRFEVFLIGCEIDDTTALYDSLGCTKDHVHEIARPMEHRGKDEFFPKAQGDDPCERLFRMWPMRADSARPETISYLTRHGYPFIVPATKGPGSVQEGVTFIKNYDVVIHESLTHTIDEFTNYSYKVHSLTQQIIPILEDKKNQIIDPVRYMLEPLRAEPEARAGVF